MLLFRAGWTECAVNSSLLGRFPAWRGMAAQFAATAGGLVAILIVAAILTPPFYSAANLTLILIQVGFIGVTGIGQTLVLLVGGIDLSVGAVIGLTMVTVAVATGGQGGRLGTAIALAFGLGLLVGVVNALLAAIRRVPAFIATFATFILAEGVLLAWTKGAPSGQIPASLGTIGAGKAAGIPVPALIFAVLLALSAFTLTRTTYGRRIYATGSNQVAARLAGIPTTVIVASAYVASAACAVVAGLLISGYTGYVDNQLIGSLNLDSIAAAVVGGTSLAGGRGGVGRTTVGVILIACLQSFMLLLNAGNAGKLIIEGAVILGAVWLQARQRGGPVRPESRQQVLPSAGSSQIP